MKTQSDFNALPMLFGALHKKMMENHQKLLSSYGLTKIHLPYLMLLSDHEKGLTQKEMIDYLFLDKAHASRALRDLLEKNMIVKDEETTYKNKYHLLDQGKKVVLSVKDETLRLRIKILESMTEEEIQLFRKLTEKIINILE